MKKLRFKVSTRMLFLVLTLACVYLACWEPTRQHALLMNTVQDWQRGTIVRNARAVLPLIVVQEEVPSAVTRDAYPSWSFYLWILGRKVKVYSYTDESQMPRPYGVYESEWKE